ncbi:MAG: indoleacetamide hydrolase [Burkholderiaceae bacterium]
MEGIPLVIKDNIDTGHLPTTAGTGALAGRLASANAPALQRLVDAGALPAAKAVMHELAFGITSNNALTGPARNPYDPSRIPGGSSGGTASAVAARLFAAGLGTDTGGSVRVPAALCGLVGFRPTVGRYPGAGVVPISHTRDTIGPMARSVADVRLIDRLMAGLPESTMAAKSLRGLRLGVPRARFWENLEPGVAIAAEDALHRLAGAGVELVDVDLSALLVLNDDTGFPVALYEVMRDLPAYLRDAGLALDMAQIVAGIASPDVRGILESQLGEQAMPQAAYRNAIDQLRPRLQAGYAQCFADHQLGALVFPTTALVARPIGDDETVELNGEREPTFGAFIRNTDLGSNVGAPGISLPMGLVDGLPAGLELEGLPGADDELLALADSVARLLAPMPAPKPR